MWCLKLNTEEVLVRVVADSDSLQAEVLLICSKPIAGACDSSARDMSWYILIQNQTKFELNSSNYVQIFFFSNDKKTQILLKMFYNLKFTSQF